MTAQGETRYMILSKIPDDRRRSKRLAVVHHGKPELLFAACDQLGNEDTWWASFGLVCYLCVLVVRAIVFWCCGYFLCSNMCLCKVFRPSFPYKLGQFYSS